MPDLQTVSDLLALSRWDGEGGSGPPEPRQAAPTILEASPEYVLPQSKNCLSATIRSKSCERLNILPPVATDGDAKGNITQ